MINAKEELEKWEDEIYSRYNVEHEAKFEDLLGKTIVEIDGAEEDSKAVLLVIHHILRTVITQKHDCLAILFRTIDLYNRFT